MARVAHCFAWLFLSTPSARRATRCRSSFRTSRAYFYPRPPRGGRLRALPLLHDDAAFLSTPSARRATCRGLCLSAPCRYFYPRPPRGGRPGSGNLAAVAAIFLSTPSARRATSSGGGLYFSFLISIHALREEGDRRAATSAPARGYFYPRPPRGGRLPWEITEETLREFLSTPSARRATIQFHRADFAGHYFYPRPPRGGRHCFCSAALARSKFLSTPSARRATGRNTARCTAWRNFYPRPPRGGRLVRYDESDVVEISIHALREEGDFLPLAMMQSPLYFYPRPPRGGRQDHRGQGSHHEGISIHALREEGDLSFRSRCSSSFKFLSTPSARRATCLGKSPRKPCTNFYPRPPRGGRLLSLRQKKASGKFLSTPSARRATRTAWRFSGRCPFLSTPSARRATQSSPAPALPAGYFYPRPPRGGRRAISCLDLWFPDISIHALREEGDRKNREKSLCFCLIIHLPA